MAKRFLLGACCVCKKVRVGGTWIADRELYDCMEAQQLLSHTYCTDCNDKHLKSVLSKLKGKQ